MQQLANLLGGNACPAPGIGRYLALQYMRSGMRHLALALERRAVRIVTVLEDLGEERHCEDQPPFGMRRSRLGSGHA